MNFQKFIDFIVENIDYLSKEDIKFIVWWNYTRLFKSVKKKYEEEKNNQTKERYLDILMFITEFLEDYQENAYKYNYENSTDFFHYEKWFWFYYKNNLLDRLKIVIKDIKSNFPKHKKTNKLEKVYNKLSEKYNKEDQKLKSNLQKKNYIKEIEHLIWQWKYQQALNSAIKYLQKYPNDKQIEKYIEKINQIKSQNHIENVQSWKDIIEKIGFLDLLKKKKLEKSDIKETYRKLKDLYRKWDYESWIYLIKHMRDKLLIKDKKLLKFYNKFVDIKNKNDKQVQYSDFAIELNSLKLMFKNTQYDDALQKANNIIKNTLFK